MARLYLSFLCDVKLIRNKLYGVDNDGLDIFISSADKFEKTEEGYYDKSEHLKQLKMLLDAGVLTQEEYDKKKEEVINSNK